MYNLEASLMEMEAMSGIFLRWNAAREFEDTKPSKK
jgi:hypothetical protein